VFKVKFIICFDSYAMCVNRRDGSTHHKVAMFNISYPMCHGAMESEVENKLDTNIEIEEMEKDRQSFQPNNK